MDLGVTNRQTASRTCYDPVGVAAATNWIERVVDQAILHEHVMRRPHVNEIAARPSHLGVAQREGVSGTGHADSVLVCQVGRPSSTSPSTTRLA